MPPTALVTLSDSDAATDATGSTSTTASPTIGKTMLSFVPLIPVKANSITLDDSLSNSMVASDECGPLELRAEVHPLDNDNLLVAPSLLDSDIIPDTPVLSFHPLDFSAPASEKLIEPEIADNDANSENAPATTQAFTVSGDDEKRETGKDNTQTGPNMFLEDSSSILKQSSSSLSLATQSMTSFSSITFQSSHPSSACPSPAPSLTFSSLRHTIGDSQQKEDSEVLKEKASPMLNMTLPAPPPLPEINDLSRRTSVLALRRLEPRQELNPTEIKQELLEDVLTDMPLPELSDIQTPTDIESILDEQTDSDFSSFALSTAPATLANTTTNSSTRSTPLPTANIPVTPLLQTILLQQSFQQQQSQHQQQQQSQQNQQHFTYSLADLPTSPQEQLMHQQNEYASIDQSALVSSLETHHNTIRQHPDKHVKLESIQWLIENVRFVQDKSVQKMYCDIVIRALKRCVELGMPEAMYSLANLYITGIPGFEAKHTVNYNKAFQLYYQSCKSSHIEAMYHVALCYETGRGTKRDTSRALQYYRKAAAAKHPGAMYKLAMVLLSGSMSITNASGASVSSVAGSSSTAVAGSSAFSATGLTSSSSVSSSLSATSSSSSTTNSLASLAHITTTNMDKLTKSTTNNSIPSRNIRDGAKWLKLAAKFATAKYPEALFELAKLHETGITNIFFRDWEYALSLYIQAGEYGHIESQFRLGQCFENGLLTAPVDPVASVYWYLQAAKQGHAQAMFELAGWYLTGAGNRREGSTASISSSSAASVSVNDRIPQSDTHAFAWARQSALCGYTKAQFAVGYFTEKGIGTDKDDEEAVQWYLLAVKNGDMSAMERLRAKGWGLEDVMNGVKRLSLQTVDKFGGKLDAGNEDVVIDMNVETKESKSVKSLVKRMKSTRRERGGKKKLECVIL